MYRGSFRPPPPNHRKTDLPRSARQDLGAETSGPYRLAATTTLCWTAAQRPRLSSSDTVTAERPRRRSSARTESVVATTPRRPRSARSDHHTVLDGCSAAQTEQL